MGKFEDLTGQKFNRLRVLRKVGKTKYGKILWLCECDCGNLCNATTGGLKSKNNQSCGCYRKEVFTNKKHGFKYSRLYNSYIHLKQRCYNPNNQDYKYYGGRGITVCDEWKDDFQAFYDWSMSHGYKDDLTIDRIDNNKGYSPENCRWVTMQYQSNNKRTNHRITYNSETHTIKEWAKITKINYGTLVSRINRNKWNIEKSLNTP